MPQIIQKAKPSINESGLKVIFVHAKDDENLAYIQTCRDAESFKRRKSKVHFHLSRTKDKHLQVFWPNAF